jgi:hypothetical protein
MRMRILLFALGALIVFTLAVNSWPFGPSPYGHRKRQGAPSRALVVSVVSYSNHNAIVEVKSRANEPVRLARFIEGEWRNPGDPSDYFPEAFSQEITNGQWLAPGAGFRVLIPVSSDRLYWRVAVGEIGQRELQMRQAVEPLFRRPWAWKYYPRERFAYATSEWVAP